jgi:fatty acid desaturase
MSDDKTGKPTDTRAFRRRTDRALLIAVIVALVVVGGGLIYLIWGAAAFATGLPCLLFGAGLVLVLWLLLSGIERFVGD